MTILGAEITPDDEAKLFAVGPVVGRQPSAFPRHGAFAAEGNHLLPRHCAASRHRTARTFRTIPRAGKGKKRASKDARARLSNDPHAIAFFKRHAEDDSKQSAPGYEFLSACPVKVEATIYAVLKAVAAAPPKRYAGGGYWEAMHGAMTGWFEVRVDGSRPRAHYRLFCRLDYDAQGADRPLLVVITGMSNRPTRIMP
jgi:hypothetical protein